MAEDRLKFRCYRCNQLLSASPKRVGTEISCPRCKAELVVPRINLEPAAAVEAPGRPGAAAQPRAHSRSAVPGTFPPPIEGIAAAIPEDLAALRPEDIRVEADFVDLVVTTSEPERPVPPPVVDLPIQEFDHPTQPTPTEASPGTSSHRADVAIVTPTAASGPSAAEAGTGAILPAITIEPPSILPREREIRQVREVVLQPSTVLAWSLLVLLSIPMAFVSGLLIGHFLWK